MYIKIIRPFVNWWYRKHPPEMVSWWRTKEKVRAKLILTEENGYQMQLEGEKYLQPNYPRGHILFGQMSKLKHAIKNHIFNETWASLEAGIPYPLMIERLKTQVLPAIFALSEDSKYDMMPPHRLSRSIRELWRAWTVVEHRLSGDRRLRAQKLKQIVCFILQEDDAYRFRFQWVAGFFNPKGLWRRLTRRDLFKDLDWALSLLEHAEVVGDMKERQRLFRRVLMAVLGDKETRESFLMLVAEVDWQKVKLTKADKYYFRGKYFKVDYPYYSY